MLPKSSRGSQRLGLEQACVVARLQTDTELEIGSMKCRLASECNTDDVVGCLEGFPESPHGQ